MSQSRVKPVRLLRDDRGATTVEYVLLLVGVALPLVAFFRYALSVLAEYYRMLSFIETLPFP